MINRIYKWLPYICFGTGAVYMAMGDMRYFLYFALLAILIKMK